MWIQKEIRVRLTQPSIILTQGTRLFLILSMILPPTLIPVFWTARAGACAPFPSCCCAHVLLRSYLLHRSLIHLAHRASPLHSPTSSFSVSSSLLLPQAIKSNDTVNWDVAVSLSNVASGSRRLWVPLFAAYFVTFLTLALLRRQYKEIAALRLRELCSARPSAEAFAVLCLDIPSMARGGGGGGAQGLRGSISVGATFVLRARGERTVWERVSVSAVYVTP